MHDNYFERYTNGEEEAVWAELLALGPKVRDTPYLPQAMAVCREMTRRSRLNLRLLINRLSELDHQFWCYMLQTSPHLARLRKDDFAQWEPCIWIQPKPGVSDILDKAEKNGITLPLALRDWMEEIGLVSLSGSHPALCPFYSSWEHPNLYPDPFEVSASIELMAESISGLPSTQRAGKTISSDDIYKSEMGIESHEARGYWIMYPDASIDVELKGVWFPTTFVGYVRKSFQWGGFPGWERYPNRPEKELALLREGLLPI